MLLLDQGFPNYGFATSFWVFQSFSLSYHAAVVQEFNNKNGQISPFIYLCSAVLLLTYRLKLDMTGEMRCVLSNRLSDLLKNCVTLTLSYQIWKSVQEMFLWFLVTYVARVINIRLSQIPSVHGTFPVMTCAAQTHIVMFWFYFLVQTSLRSSFFICMSRDCIQLFCVCSSLVCLIIPSCVCGCVSISSLASQLINQYISCTRVQELVRTLAHYTLGH